MNLECVYGGTFDPFHNGHEAICHHVLEQTAALELPLRLIPCARPALKQQAQASDFDRLNMLNEWRNAQQMMSRIIVDAIEVDQGSVSYTANTVAQLGQQDKHPTQRIWVLGVDAFNALSKWHNCEALISRLNFWVISRPSEARLENRLNLTQVAGLDELWQKSTGRFWFDTRLALPEASSTIRQWVGQKQIPVPQPIADYIYKHELYQASA